jgi:hypothetical protein
VVTVDIKCAFLKAKLPENMELMVKMTGEHAELMCEINPDLRRDDQGIIYLRSVKALYGHIEAVRLFFNDLDNTIQEKMGFTQNQYDPCVYNKGDGDEKVTIQVHVDDLKNSPCSKNQIERVIEQLRAVYNEITVHHREEHDYLGMTLIYIPEKKTIF